MRSSFGIALTSLLLLIPHVAGASNIVDEFVPGTPYYFESFDPGKKPWDPGTKLNIEEVFKNYQYYEILYDKDLNTFTVYRYERGNKLEEVKYLLQPDKALLKQ